MAGLGIGLIVLIVIVIAVVFWAIGIYNRLVSLRERVKNSWAQIDVQLKRRYDLIPNLVETAKGYMSHEKETLEAVIQARASATSAQINVSGDPTNLKAMSELAGAEGMLQSALGRLLAVSENYPELKANENMLALQEELTSTENKVSFARQAYNDAGNNYNTYKQQFPPVIFAGMFNFQDADYFEVKEPEQREAPQVSF